MSRQLSAQDTVETLVTCSFETTDALVAIARRHEAGCLQSKCASCCSEPLTVTAPEALYIARYMKEHLTREDFHELQAKVEETCALINEKAWDDFEEAKVPCALYDEVEGCKIFDARPISCRSRGCLGKKPLARCVKEEEGNGAFAEAEQYGKEMVSKLKETVKGQGLDGQEYEFHSVVRRALVTTQAELLWFKELNIFGNCRLPESDP